MGHPEIIVGPGVLYVGVAKGAPIAATAGKPVSYPGGPQEAVAPVAIGTAITDSAHGPTAARAGWAKVGWYGAVNYSSEGVRLRINRNAEIVRSAGSIVGVKSFLTEAGISVSVDLMDFTFEALRSAFPQVTVASNKANLAKLAQVAVPTHALLFRGTNLSPYSEMTNLQLWLPAVALTSDSVEAMFGATAPTSMTLEWSTMAAAERTVDNTLKLAAIGEDDILGSLELAAAA